MICKLCNNISNIPIETSCNHTFCFLCLNLWMSYDCKNMSNCLYECPHCETKLDTSLLQINNVHDTNRINTSYLWLYSSNFNDTWWAYDTNNNRNIELIYKNYEKKK